MQVHRMAVGPMETNCYIIADEKTNEGAVIDPGADGSLILDKIETLGIKLQYILLTHTHYDHIGAVAQLKRATGAKLAVSEEDAAGLTDGRWNLSAYGGSPVEAAEADILLKDGDELLWGRDGKQSIQVLSTPGHTKGGVCFLCGGELFSGDTLFAGSVGRSDFPGGSMDTLVQSIKTKLMPLDDGVRVYPGHGPTTTIGRERAGNPYIQ
ncbi:MAG: MBL fold metallo-hydrolase [Clostridia bacterium]|nr:MBL fold metallo-hydrolase [Clostridia bacterium]